MAINYIHPATQETTTKEPWYWVAVYRDGSTLSQFEVSNGTAIFHRSGEIDASQLIELRLCHDTMPGIAIAVPEGAKPVHLYRHRRITEELIAPDGAEHLNREWRTKIWIIGFKHDSRYWLAYVDEYGHVMFSSDYHMFLNTALPEEIR